MLKLPIQVKCAQNGDFYLGNTHNEWDIRVEYRSFIVILLGFSRSCVNIPDWHETLIRGHKEAQGPYLGRLLRLLYNPHTAQKVLKNKGFEVHG